jgi:hypothetical protein
MAISVHFSKTQLAYTGAELRPHFLLSQFNLKGPALAAFIGPCQVETEHLVDWEDRLAKDHIQAKAMVHFMGEFFGSTLKEGVLRQRLLMATMAQSINDRLGGRMGEFRVTREGDDLFSKGRKLSVSIVTASPVSMLLHAGINIDPAGAPVPAIGLSELGIAGGAGDLPLQLEQWIDEVLRSFANEWESIEWACAKVRPVM